MRVAYVMISAGALTLAAGLWYVTRPSLDSGELKVALSPLLLVSGNRAYSADDTVRVNVSIPKNAMWTRIRQVLGESDYIIAALNYETKTHMCFENTRSEVQAALGGSVVRLQAAEQPLYSFRSGCHSNGLLFRAKPGDNIDITCKQIASTLGSSGTLVVAAYYTFEIKDRLVSSSVQRDTLPMGWAGCVFGLLLVLAGVIRLLRTLRVSGLGGR